MRMDSQPTPHGLILTPMEKQLDAAAAPRFKSAVTGWIDQGHRRILLDLEKVAFIDSSGLGAILSLLKAVGDDGDILLCRIQPAVEPLFKLTRMNRVFHIFDTRREALAHLAPQS